jgi:hypothetical protein
MNKIAANLIGGLAGAAALNIIHQTIKQIDSEAPRVDLVGEEALNKVITSTGGEPLTGNTLFTATLAADLLSNAFYYSLIGLGKKKNLLLRGATYGLAAGVGALQLTEPMGLNDAPITKTDKTKALTVGWYLLGGIITALTIKALRTKDKPLDMIASKLS